MIASQLSYYKYVSLSIKTISIVGIFVGVFVIFGGFADAQVVNQVIQSDGSLKTVSNSIVQKSDVVGIQLPVAQYVSLNKLQALNFQNLPDIKTVPQDTQKTEQYEVNQGTRNYFTSFYRLDDHNCVSFSNVLLCGTFSITKLR